MRRFLLGGAGVIDPLLLVASMGLAFVVTGGTLGVIGDRAYSYSLTRTGTAFYFVGMMVTLFVAIVLAILG